MWWGKDVLLQNVTLGNLTDVNVTFAGAGGDDQLSGGNGADELHGGAGNDFLIAEVNGDSDGKVDTLDGGLGNDVYYVAAEDVIVADTGGNDTVYAWNTNWTLGAG